MKKTIEQIRIEKGFKTAGEFANYIGMAEWYDQEILQNLNNPKPW